MNTYIKNISYILLGQIAVLGLALIVPRFILSGYGSDTNGFLSTIGQIMAYMSLLEAGIGQATRNELYRFVQGDVIDRSGISSVMTVSRKTYRRTTVVYALLVIVLAFLLPFVIKTDLNHISVFLVILIEGASGVISYYFVQNYTNLLMVDGRQYVNSNIDVVFKGMVYLIKIVMALLGVNIIIMEIGFFVAVFIKLFIYEKYMKQLYGWLDFSLCSKEGRLKDRGPYMITEIAWVVFSSTDMIIISIICSTKSASVYTIYYMVFLTINKLADAVFSSLKFNLGQIYHKSTEDYIKKHDVYNSAFIGALAAFLTVAYFLCIPFVALYTKGITDIDYIDRSLPLGFCLVFLLSWCRMVSEHLIGIAGFAKKLTIVSIVEVAINITLSIIFAYIWGVRGVLYATAAALPLKVVYCNLLADKGILKRSCLKTVKILTGNILLFLILAVCKQLIDIQIGSYTEFILLGAVFTLCSVAIFFLVNILINKELLSVFKKKKPM